MKNVTMISRRSFLKAAMAASAVSALAFTGCGGSASSTVAASSTASSAAASAAAEGGQTFKVGIVNYVDHASLNQIVESVESRLMHHPLLPDNQSDRLPLHKRLSTLNGFYLQNLD